MLWEIKEDLVFQLCEGKETVSALKWMEWKTKKEYYDEALT